MSLREGEAWVALDGTHGRADRSCHAHAHEPVRELDFGAHGRGWERAAQFGVPEDPVPTQNRRATAIGRPEIPTCAGRPPAVELAGLKGLLRRASHELPMRVVARALRLGAVELAVRAVASVGAVARRVERRRAAARVARAGGRAVRVRAARRRAVGLAERAGEARRADASFSPAGPMRCARVLGDKRLVASTAPRNARGAQQRHAADADGVGAAMPPVAERVARRERVRRAVGQAVALDVLSVVRVRAARRSRRRVGGPADLVPPPRRVDLHLHRHQSL